MIKKIKKIWEVITYPTGKDEEFDKECEDAFHRFLDRVTGFFYIAFIIFGAISTYFFVTHGLMK